MCASLLVAGACGADPREPQESEEAPRAAALTIPLGLKPGDSIVAVDAAAASPAEPVEVVWIEARAAGGGAPRYALASSSGAPGDKWSAPVEVASGVVGGLRAAAGPDAVHVVCGPLLSHFVRDGASWRALGDVTEPKLRAEGFDARVVGGELLIAFFHRPETPYALAERTDAHRQRLLVARLRGAEAPVVREIATFAASLHPSPPPRLVVEGERLHVLAGLNLEQEDRRGARSVAGEAFWLSSSDGGATWTKPARVFEPPLIGGLASVDAAARENQLIAVASAHGIRVASSANAGGSWTAPVQLAGYDTSLARGTGESGAVCAALGKEELVLAWIDARYRKGKRSVTNPLGGVPWSDDPAYQVNNDVFALRVPLASLAAPAKSGAKVQRLTADGSFADSLHLFATGDGFLALWAGRARVGDDLASAGSEPALFCAALP